MARLPLPIASAAHRALRRSPAGRRTFAKATNPGAGRHRIDRSFGAWASSMACSEVRRGREAVRPGVRFL